VLNVLTPVDVLFVLPTELKNHPNVLVNKDTLIATMTDLAVLVLTNVTLALDLLNLVLLVLKEELTTHHHAHVHPEPPKSTKSVPPVTNIDVLNVTIPLTIVPSVKLTELITHQPVHVLMVSMN